MKNPNISKIVELADGVRTSKEISKIVGCGHKYVQKIMLKLDLPRRSRGSAIGELNGQYKRGYYIDHSGYVLVSAPEDHPNARTVRDKRKRGRILLHRLVMEKHLGRYLAPSEVVDHIDGDTLNNHISNLRVFASNGDHLKATITGKPHRMSAEGRAKLRQKREGRQFSDPTLVDIYRQNKVAGVIRKQCILNHHKRHGRGLHVPLETNLDNLTRPTDSHPHPMT